MKSRICTLAGVLVVAGSYATVAHAQDDDVGEGDTESSETSTDEKSGEGEGGEATKEVTAADEAKRTEAASSDTATSDTSPVEEKGKTYRFVGARYRGIVVPAFMIHLFADGGTTLYVNSVGPEFGIRKDGFEYNLSAWLSFYSMDWTAFKGKDDAKTEWELVQSNLDVLFLTSDFLWSHEFSPEVALNYGLGAGLGIVFGSLPRRQSYPNTGAGDNPNDPQTWTKCFDQASDPVYCTSDNEHFESNHYEEPSWFGNGSKPVFFPWLVLQTGLRIKPTRRFVGRIDLGFGTSGLFFGLGADYGL